MILYIVRHAQSESNRDHSLQCDPDSHVSKEGRNQVLHLYRDHIVPNANILRELKCADSVISAFSRARQTFDLLRGYGLLKGSLYRQCTYLNELSLSDVVYNTDLYQNAGLDAWHVISDIAKTKVRRKTDHIPLVMISHMYRIDRILNHLKIRSYVPFSAKSEVVPFSCVSMGIKNAEMLRLEIDNMDYTYPLVRRMSNSSSRFSDNFFEYKEIPENIKTASRWNLLGVPKLIYDVEESYDAMIQMIRDARECICLSTFEFNTDEDYHKPSVTEELEMALARGVKIHIQTSALNMTTNSMYNQGLLRLQSKYGAALLKLDLKYRPNNNTGRETCWENTIFDKMSKICSVMPNTPATEYWGTLFSNGRSGIHRQFMVTDQNVMIGRTNTSRKYLNRTKNVLWIESCVKFPSSHPKLLEYTRLKIMSCLDFRSVPFYSMFGIISDNISMYQNVLHIIRTSKKSVYLENQYFFTGECGQNEVSSVLLNKIEYAFRNRKKYKVVICTNLQFRDDGDQNIRVCTFRALAKKCIRIFLEAVDHVTKGNSSRYVTIYCPNELSNVCLHNKIYASDGKNVLFGSANIYDASYMDKAHIEMGWVCYDSEEVYNKIARQSIALLQSDTHVCLERIKIEHTKDWTSRSLSDIQHIPFSHPVLDTILQDLKSFTMVDLPIHWSGTYK